MLDLAIHLQQAEFNESAAIDNQFTHPHVSVIMVFYAALHYVEVYAAWHKHNIYELYPDEGLTQHQRRWSYLYDISMCKGCPDLTATYSRLHFASEQARYLKKLKTNSQRHFKHGAGFYIEKLQLLKNELQISLIKSAIDTAIDKE